MFQIRLWHWCWIQQTVQIRGKGQLRSPAWKVIYLSFLSSMEGDFFFFSMEADADDENQIKCKLLRRSNQYYSNQFCLQSSRIRCKKMSGMVFAQGLVQWSAFRGSVSNVIFHPPELSIFAFKLYVSPSKHLVFHQSPLWNDMFLGQNASFFRSVTFDFHCLGYQSLPVAIWMRNLVLSSSIYLIFRAYQSMHIVYIMYTKSCIAREWPRSNEYNNIRQWLQWWGEFEMWFFSIDKNYRNFWLCMVSFCMIYKMKII